MSSPHVYPEKSSKLAERRGEFGEREGCEEMSGCAVGTGELEEGTGSPDVCSVDSVALFVLNLRVKARRPS